MEKAGRSRGVLRRVLGKQRDHDRSSSWRGRHATLGSIGGPEPRRLWRTRSRVLSVLVTILMGLGVLPAPTVAGWIDSDSLPEDRVKSFEGREFELVFSDEFNREGRTFHDGTDPRWTAVNKNDYTNHALQFYSHDYVGTRNGSMFIITNNTNVDFEYYDTPHKKFKKMSKTYVSAMVQSWNKFCFTGGIVEIQATLPGAADIGGLWPAMWLMGNLARATFTTSSDFQWPWSYDVCNRTTDEQVAWQHQQEISACDGAVHWGFHPHNGRGAPEIDILEAMSGDKIGEPYMSTSLQVAPGTDAMERPDLGEIPHEGSWYHKEIFYGNNSRLNNWFYGVYLEHKNKEKSYYCDAVSGNHQLESSHFQTMHTYRLEWQPGSDKQQGYIDWYVDGERVYGITDTTLDKNGAQIPVEPMYLILNTAISQTWGFPNCDLGECACDCFDASDPACACSLAPNFYSLFPAEFEVDSVRVYQQENNSLHTVGCDPANYPTKDFIKAHSDRYKDPDMEHVMLAVAMGGGRCTDSSDCNGNECAKGKLCKCGEGWTGPNCLAAAAGDPPVQHSPAWPIKAPFVPPGLSFCFGVLIGVFMVTLLVRFSHRRKRLLYVTIDSSGITIPPPPRSSFR